MHIPAGPQPHLPNRRIRLLRNPVLVHIPAGPQPHLPSGAHSRETNPADTVLPCISPRQLSPRSHSAHLWNLQAQAAFRTPTARCTNTCYLVSVPAMWANLCATPLLSPSPGPHPRAASPGAQPRVASSLWAYTLKKQKKIKTSRKVEKKKRRKVEK